MSHSQRGAEYDAAVRGQCGSTRRTCRTDRRSVEVDVQHALDNRLGGKLVMPSGSCSLERGWPRRGAVSVSAFQYSMNASASLLSRPRERGTPRRLKEETVIAMPIFQEALQSIVRRSTVLHKLQNNGGRLRFNLFFDIHTWGRPVAHRAPRGCAKRHHLTDCAPMSRPKTAHGFVEAAADGWRGPRPKLSSAVQFRWHLHQSQSASLVWPVGCDRFRSESRSSGKHMSKLSSSCVLAHAACAVRFVRPGRCDRVPIEGATLECARGRPFLRSCSTRGVLAALAWSAARLLTPPRRAYCSIQRRR